MEKDFRFTLKGKKYTFESFVNAYGMPEDMAETAINEYIRTGLATEDMDHNTARAKKLQDDMDTIYRGEDAENEEYEAAQNSRNERLNNCATTGLRIPFSTVTEANKFLDSVRRQIDIPLDECHIDGITGTLTLDRVTDAEAQIISTMYNTTRFVRKATITTDKTVRAATNIIGYVAKDVAAPIAGTILKSGANAIGSLFHTAVKTGGEAVKSAKEAYKETKANMATDPVILEAKKDLKKAGATISNKIGNIGGTSGIEII